MSKEVSKAKVMIRSGDVSPVSDKISNVSRVKGEFSKIMVSDIVPDKYDISGFVFSKRFLKAANLKEIKIPKSDSEWKALMEYAKIAKKIDSDSDGGPTVGENYIKIWIDNVNPNAGSEANYIWMYFGWNRRIKLNGVDGTRFPRGWWVSWNLNNVSPSEYLETIPTDAWDDVHLVNSFGDGIKINRMKIRHSSVTILDWNCNAWLDGSKMEKHGKLGLAAKILAKKLGYVGNRWTPQIHWAARELGKTKGSKYGTNGAWCSEFASWCLRKALWDTPSESIGSDDMENYFNSKGRKYTKGQILNKQYTLKEGDYLRLFGGTHSGLFIRYIDNYNSPTNNTRIQTIEGNIGSKVGVRTRTLGDLHSVGNTR